MEYLVRSAVFENFERALGSVRALYPKILDQAGIDREMLQDPDEQVPYEKFLLALQVAAHLTGRDDFGLVLATNQKASMLGALGRALTSSPSVGQALDILCTYCATHKQGVHIQTSSGDNGQVLFTYEITAPNPPGLNQQTDLAVGLGIGILRELLGYRWFPETVFLARAAPYSSPSYEAYFGAPVVFESDITAIALERGLMDQPVCTSDIVLNRVLLKHLEDDATSQRADIVTEARKCIMRRLRSGDCTIEGVAQDLSLTPRTFQRRLSRYNYSFRKLLDGVRVELAQTMLRNSSASMSEISTSLGYAELSVFSRSFKRNTGLSPSVWRVSACG